MDEADSDIRDLDFSGDEEISQKSNDIIEHASVIEDDSDNNYDDEVDFDAEEFNSDANEDLLESPSKDLQKDLQHSIGLEQDEEKEQDYDSASPSKQKVARCFKCKKKGHIYRNCPMRGKTLKVFRCSQCNKMGHLKRDCPMNKSKRKIEGSTRFNVVINGDAKTSGGASNAGKRGNNRVKANEDVASQPHSGIQPAEKTPTEPEQEIKLRQFADSSAPKVIPPFVPLPLPPTNWSVLPLPPPTMNARAVYGSTERRHRYSRDEIRGRPGDNYIKDIRSYDYDERRERSYDYDERRERSYDYDDIRHDLGESGAARRRSSIERNQPHPEEKRELWEWEAMTARRKERETRYDERRERSYDYDERRERSYSRDEIRGRPGDNYIKDIRSYDYDERRERSYDYDERRERAYDYDERRERSYDYDERRERAYDYGDEQRRDVHHRR